MFTGAKTAVMFEAHSDDAMVCAGTLHRLVQQRCRVHVVTFGPAAIQTDRCGSHPSIDVVRPEWEKALDLIGVRKEDRKFCGFVPSAELSNYRQDICQTAFDYIEKHKPDIVFTLSPEDENPAHAVVGVETERVMRGRVPIAIRCQFSWNYSIGRSNLYVALSAADYAVKQAVIDAYQSQHWRYAYKELLTAQARADGLSVKVPYAEKFEIIRSVV